MRHLLRLICSVLLLQGASFVWASTPVVRVLLADSIPGWTDSQNRNWTGMDSNGIKYRLKGPIALRPCAKVLQSCVEVFRPGFPQRVYRADRWISESGDFAFQNSTHRGQWVWSSANQGLQSIVYADLEDYVASVLPTEMGPVKIEIYEALRAQAIAARTYVAKRLQNPRTQEFDVYRDVRDQVYGGLGARHSITDRATQTTQSMVLMYQQNLAETFFHANSGGWLGDVGLVWGLKSVEYLVQRKDTMDNGRFWVEGTRMWDWERRWSRKQVEDLFRKWGPSFAKSKPDRWSQLAGIEAVETGKDGRILQLIVQTDQKPFVLNGEGARRVFRDAKGGLLPSGRFSVVEWSRSEVVLRGRGNGHGVGMCQTGAMQRAKAGQKAEAILAWYYPGTQLKSLGDSD